MAARTLRGFCSFGMIGNLPGILCLFGISFFLVLAGCGKETFSAANDGPAITIIIKSVEPAPDDFDAWDFVWKGPKRALDAGLEMIVLEPDGKEYARQTFAAFPGKSENIQTSFSPGFAGADPKILSHHPIRLRFRATKGSFAFGPAEVKTFKFRFFKKDANGDVEWRNPFKTIAAVVE